MSQANKSGGAKSPTLTLRALHYVNQSISVMTPRQFPQNHASGLSCNTDVGAPCNGCTYEL